MRVNVYDSDITGEVHRIERTVLVEGEPTEFVGIRIYLLSPQGADKSAVTFWFRAGHEHELVTLLNVAEKEASYD